MEVPLLLCFNLTCTHDEVKLFISDLVEGNMNLFLYLNSIFWQEL